MTISSEQIEQEILLRSKKEFSRKAPPKDFKDLPLVKQSRLSVMEIDQKSWKKICKMGKI